MTNREFTRPRKRAPRGARAIAIAKQLFRYAELVESDDRKVILLRDAATEIEDLVQSNRELSRKLKERTPILGSAASSDA